MPVPSYIAIADAEIVPGKPTKTSLFSRLRDNVLAIIGGDVDAPLIERLAISSGGSGADGAWINSTTLTGSGYFEPLSIVRSSAWTLPSVMVARCSGDVTISSALDLPAFAYASALGAQYHLRARLGNAGSDGVLGGGVNTAGGGGGGSTGAGGAGGASGTGVAGAGGAACAASSLRWPWLSMQPRLGSPAGQGYSSVFGTVGIPGLPGGAFILLVEGDVTMTGGTITADGGVGGDSGGAPGPQGAGGGAGSIVIVATGTITGGTYNARGGGGIGTGGGGGGGYVGLVASAFAGSRTKTVTGGGITGSGVAGSAGYSEEITLTAAQIRSLLFRSF